VRHRDTRVATCVRQGCRRADKRSQSTDFIAAKRAERPALRQTRHRLYPRRIAERVDADDNSRACRPATTATSRISETAMDFALTARDQLIAGTRIPHEKCWDSD
jgi:hypothetical protein